MPRWRVPAVLTAVVVLAQLAHQHPLVDVVTGRVPDDLRLAYPVLHILLAPITLPGDWLNGGSRGDFAGFAAWAVAVFLVARIFFATAPRRVLREVGYNLFHIPAEKVLIDFGLKPVERDVRPGIGSGWNT